MPWTKTGDSAATYPSLMQIAGYRGADDRTVNEVAGWLFRCAFQSAAHMTDYVIDAGTAHMLGGARTPLLIKMCVAAGLLVEEKRGAMRVWRLIEDPEFIHIKLRAEVEWERQQRNDTKDPALRVPVLRRDGDNCRWCGVLVQWRGRTSNRTATLDHLQPGQPGTPASMVVACKRCNSSRQDNPQWDDDHELWPAPARPLYGAHTATYLTEHGYPTEPNLTSDERPARSSEAEAAATNAQPATTTSSGTASPTPQPHGAEVAPKSPENSTDRSVRMGSPGSGRDGSVTGSSPGTPVPGIAQTPPPPAPRTRGRRGGRRNPPRGETR